MVRRNRKTQFHLIRKTLIKQLREWNVNEQNEFSILVSSLIPGNYSRTDVRVSSIMI